MPTCRTLFFACLIVAATTACRSAREPARAAHAGDVGHAPRAAVAAVRPAIVPRPLALEPREGVFRFGERTAITCDGTPGALGAARLFAEWVGGTDARRGGSGPDAVHFAIDAGGGDDPELGVEGYTLSVTPERVLVRANAERGLVHAVSTLRQLAPPEVERRVRERALEAGATRVDDFELPCVEIRDRPRFAWRGMLLDCGRHFYSKAAVLRAIDLAAYHKLDVFHWHLTEDQGWRLAIEAHPELTEIGAWRTNEQGERYGGFYTHDDVREVVAFAARRGVSVVPEIEMPGHALAALAARPELSCTGGPFEVGTRWGVYDDVYCAGNDATFAFLEHVLDEVVALFPSEFVHIGGDECPKTRWKECARCQARIAAEGLADEHELQSWFVRRIERHLASRGRRLVGWDEILEGGLAPGATVQSWRGMDGAIAAARAGHDVIVSPTSHCYFDYPENHDAPREGWMGVIPLEKVHAFEPIPPELSAEEAKHVLGVEGNVWTERIPEERFESMAYPRLAALAEVGWSPRESRDAEEFARRMMAHYDRLDALGVRYAIPQPAVVRKEGAVELVARDGGAEIRYTLDGSVPTASSTLYRGAIVLGAAATLRAAAFRAGRASDPITAGAAP